MRVIKKLLVRNVFIKVILNYVLKLVLDQTHGL